MSENVSRIDTEACPAIGLSGSCQKEAGHDGWHRHEDRQGNEEQWGGMHADVHRQLKHVEAERDQLKEEVAALARELLTVRDEEDRLAAALESIAKLTERGPEHDRLTWYDAADEAGLIAREALNGGEAK